VWAPASRAMSLALLPIFSIAQGAIDLLAAA
jgi:hypothetical protein